MYLEFKIFAAFAHALILRVDQFLKRFAANTTPNFKVVIIYFYFSATSATFKNIFDHK